MKPAVVKLLKIEVNFFKVICGRNYFWVQVIFTQISLQILDYTEFRIFL